MQNEAMASWAAKQLRSAGVPYRWPEWTRFKSWYLLALAAWWGYMVLDTLWRVHAPAGERESWKSLPILNLIAEIVLLAAVVGGLFMAREARAQFRSLTLDYDSADRDEGAELARRTGGVTASQVADFGLWRTAVVAALVLFLLTGIGRAAFGPPYTAEPQTVDILSASWIAAIITARLFWSLRSFGRVFHSVAVPESAEPPKPPKPPKKRQQTVQPIPDRPLVRPASVTSPGDPVTSTTTVPSGPRTRPVVGKALLWLLATVVSALVNLYVTRYL